MVSLESILQLWHCVAHFDAHTFSASRPAESCCSSGLVLLGSKAVSEVSAAALSEPDLLYSFGSIFMLSLSCVSLRASVWLLCEKGRTLRVIGAWKD